MLARWLRELDSEWDSEVRDARVAYVRMTRGVRLAYEMGCEMFGRGLAQSHVGAWCARSARPRRGRGAQGPQGSGFMSEILGMQAVMKSSWCTRILLLLNVFLLVRDCWPSLCTINT